MSEVLVFVMFGAGVVVSFIFRQISHGTWKSVGAEMGLEFSNKWMGSRTLQGRLRGFGVQISEKSDGQAQRIMAEVFGVNPGFTLGRDSAFQRMVKPDIETGDQVFDERTRIEGDEDRALAVLGDEARRLTEIVVTGAEGEVKDLSILSALSGIRHARSSLETMIDLAQTLRRPRDEDLPGLLAQRALEDSSRGVRLQAFRRLAWSYSSTDEARDTAETLLGAHGAGLRLEAARVLLQDRERGEQASEVLQDLATRVHVDSSLRREAVETLSHSNYRHAAIPTMAALLDSSKREPPPVRRAALEALVQTRAEQELLAVQPADAAEAELLARGLGFLDVSAQPRLVELLDHPEDRVRREVAVALGRVGDLGAVASLRKLAGTGSLFRSAVARAAESAISDIQNRSGGSQAGEISLVAVAPLQGAVSPIVAREGGEVSLAANGVDADG